MRLEHMILVRVDDHLIEPPDMFANHVPARFRDQAPRRRLTGRFVRRGEQT